MHKNGLCLLVRIYYIFYLVNNLLIIMPYINSRTLHRFGSGAVKVLICFKRKVGEITKLG